MSCSICGQKMPNCDCTSGEREMHGEIEEMQAEIDRLKAEKAADWKAACESARIAAEEIMALRRQVKEKSRPPCGDGKLPD